MTPEGLVEKLKELVTQNNQTVSCCDTHQAWLDGRCEAFEYVLELLG
jgi:hypothetical protein